MDFLDKQLIGSNLCNTECVEQSKVIHPETCVDNIVISHESLTTLNDWIGGNALGNINNYDNLKAWLSENWTLEDYSLQPATTESLGGIMVGNNLSIEEDGRLSVDVSSLNIPSINNASFSNYGIVKLGNSTVINTEFSNSTIEYDESYVFPIRLDLNSRMGIELPKQLFNFSQKQSDWNENDDTDSSYIKNKPLLSVVATTGSYLDLVNLPDIVTTSTLTNYYTKQEIVSLMSAPMQYKGSVSAYADLSNIENPSIGDVYNVVATGMNYAWDGQAWDALGSTIIMPTLTSSAHASGTSYSIEGSGYAGSPTKFLREDGTWQTVSGGGSSVSITAGAGLNTTSDDTSVDGGTITDEGTLYLTKVNSNVGSFGLAANATPDYDGSFNVPYITVDKYGRITAASSKTVTLPEKFAVDNPISAYYYENNISQEFPVEHIFKALSEAIVTNNSNHVHILSTNTDIQGNNISGALPIGAMIILFAGYLKDRNNTSGQLVFETVPENKLYEYIISNADADCYASTTFTTPMVGSEDLLTYNHVRLITSNWSDYTRGLPNGYNDYIHNTAIDSNGDIIGGSTYGPDDMHHKYIFTFMNISYGGDKSYLESIIEKIKQNNIDQAWEEFLSTFEYNDGEPSQSIPEFFNNVIVSVEHRSSPKEDVAYGIF